ncbi:hypothetical protein NFI96_006051, partial [Prochilodus magdalenae]
PDPLTPESLAEACQSPASDSTLKSAISQISKRNAWVDGKHVFDAEYHFDDESFEKARKLITQGVSDVKTSLKQGNYEYARQRLGETMHTLQDFYSHSNWIELENRSPYPVLIKADQPFQNLADKNTPTCSSCDNDCTGNILESIISQKKLTSGYFSLTSPKKPNVPADGAVGVEVEGHQAFWTCDTKPFILVLTTEPPHTDSLGVSTKTKAGLVTEDDPLPF